MLKNNYLQTPKEANSIKNFLIKNRDPILQKQDYYIPPRTKGNVSTEEYIKKMAQKTWKKPYKKNSYKSQLIIRWCKSNGWRKEKWGY